jgi:formylglycine-generating enzyme required for sulfatase activity
VQLVVQDTIGTSPIENITKRVTSLVKCSDGTLVGRGTVRLRFPSPPYLEDKANKISLVGVRGGTFEMGCKAGRDDKTEACNADNAPLHWVKVNDFKIGKYEITQGVWKAIMGSLPSIAANNRSDVKPVVSVSYDQIVVKGFLEKLNALTGKNYRLPTDAEWEYAARGCDAGNCENFQFSGSDNLDDVAWHSGNCNSLQPVGGKFPNKLGICDMSGSVLEWCSDWYSTTYYPTNTTQDSPQDNPTGPITGSYRLLHAVNLVPAGGRFSFEYFDNIGFRVVLPAQ